MPNLWHEHTHATDEGYAYPHLGWFRYTVPSEGEWPDFIVFALFPAICRPEYNGMMATELRRLSLIRLSELESEYGVVDWIPFTGQAPRY